MDDELSKCLRRLEVTFACWGGMQIQKQLLLFSALYLHFFCNATHQESSSLKKWRLILHLSNLEDPCDLLWPTEGGRGHTMWPSSLNLRRPSSFSSHPLGATQGKTTLWGCYWEMRLGVAETIISLWASSSDSVQPLTTQHVSMPSWSIRPTWVLLKPMYSSYV